MSDRPLVSIIIPTYNRKDVLPRAIRSVQAQTYRNLEIIVVDNGSTDGTQDVIKPFLADPRVRAVTLPMNRHVGGAYNAGLAEAKGVYATFLYDDDELFPEAMEILVTKAEELGPAVHMIFGDCVDDMGKPAGWGLDQEGYVTFADALRGRFRGEFSGIWRMSAIQDLRFEEGVVGVESLVWHEMYRKSDAYYVRRPIRRYFRRRLDSISIPRFNEKHLKGYLLTSRLYLERFGEDLRRIAPSEYGAAQYRIALWTFLIGSRAEALDYWRKGYQAAPGRFGKLLWAALQGPRFLLRWALVAKTMIGKWSGT